MTLWEVQTLLEAAGFVLQPSGMFSRFYDDKCRSYLRSSSGPWKIGAYSEVDDPDKRAPRVDMGLRLNPTAGSIGTVHRILSMVTLRAKLSEIVASFDTLAQQDHLLKCPKCGMRWVSIKEPLAGGKQFTPFLSCQGMYRARGRMGKYTPATVCRTESLRCWYIRKPLEAVSDGSSLNGYDA